MFLFHFLFNTDTSLLQRKFTVLLEENIIWVLPFVFDFCTELCFTQEQLYSLLDLTRKSFETSWGGRFLYLSCETLYKISVDCIRSINTSLRKRKILLFSLCTFSFFLNFFFLIFLEQRFNSTAIEPNIYKCVLAEDFLCATCSILSKRQ